MFRCFTHGRPPLERLASGAGRSGEMWITGKASATAAAKLAALGWKAVRTPAALRSGGT